MLLVLALWHLANPTQRMVVQPPPPIAGGSMSGRRLIAYDAGPARCDGDGISPQWREPVVPSAAFITSSEDDDLAPQTLTFRIAESGRPSSIGDGERPAVRHSELDLAPALAAWRFDAGRPREDCSVTFTPHAYRADAVPQEYAIRYAALPGLGRSGLNVWPSFAPANSNCIDERPARRVSVYPDFKDIAQPAGRLSASFFTFDVDAGGMPQNVKLLASDGNAQLDRAGLEAMRKWRFVAGKTYHGCRYFFWRGGTPPMPAPTPPAKEQFPAADSCAGDGEWKYLPSLARHYPPAFRRRGIEGWAIVRYDVAPWGETGNVEVLASEPADAFADAARTIVAQARQEVSEKSRVGCIDRVFFKMPNGPANVQAERD